MSNIYLQKYKAGGTELGKSKYFFNLLLIDVDDYSLSRGECSYVDNLSQKLKILYIFIY